MAAADMGGQGKMLQPEGKQQRSVTEHRPGQRGKVSPPSQTSHTARGLHRHFFQLRRSPAQHPRTPRDTKPESQLQPPALVHEWGFGNLAEGMDAVCIPALSYPVLPRGIKNSYMPRPSLETTTASFSSSGSPDLSQPLVHSRGSYFS